MMNVVAKFVFRRFVCQHVLKTCWPFESGEDELHVCAIVIIVLTPDLYLNKLSISSYPSRSLNSSHWDSLFLVYMRICPD